MKQNMSAVAAGILAALFFFLTLLFLSAGISNACADTGCAVNTYSAFNDLSE
ncbi:MAG: hypothetical protein OEM01_03665 [Desulfobulbaceae bacterium]|nr:hypothetical protein [Desulfobulbaceae bacterium]